MNNLTFLCCRFNRYVVFAICFFTCYAVSWGQTGAPHEVGWGGVELPLVPGAKDFALRLKNTSGQDVTDLRLYVLGSDDVPILIEAMDIQGEEAKVDDNDDGKLGPFETDSRCDPPAASCRSILESGSIGDQDTVRVTVSLNVPAPPGARLWAVWSYVTASALDGDNRHHDMISVVPLGPAGETFSAELPPAAHLGHFQLVNSTGDFIHALLILHPGPLEGLILEAPYENSQAFSEGPLETIVVFNPPLAPRDYVAAGLRLGLPTELSSPPMQFITMETSPYVCSLSINSLEAGACDPFGNYTLWLDIDKNDGQAVGEWKEYTFTNNSTGNVSDLHVLFSGTGGSLEAVVVEQPEGCPAAAVPSNGRISNRMDVDWGEACIRPGQSVRIKVCTKNGPLRPEGGYWTLGGEKVADLNLDGDVKSFWQGGLPGGPIHFFLGTAFIGAHTPLNDGPELVALTGLPADGSSGPLTAFWDNGLVCGSSGALLFTAPQCPAAGAFQIESIRQISYKNPVVYDHTRQAELVFKYYNPLPQPDRYLNLMYLPPNAIEPVWLLDNIALEAFDDTLSHAVIIDLPGYESFSAPLIDRIFLLPTISEQIEESMPSALQFSAYPLGQVSYDFGNNAGPRGPLDGVFIEPLPSQPQRVWERDSSRTVLRGCSMPNIDLVDSLHYGDPSVPADYANDFNACGPAAATNSFSWLRAQHAEIEARLDSAFSTANGDSTARRQMLYEFSRLMYRQTDSYTFIDSFIMGKLAFIDKYRIPAHVKFQSIILRDDINSPDSTYGHFAECQNAPTDSLRPNAAISLEWLYEEMKKGEDVELLVHWVTYDSLGNPVYTGHYVTLTGIRYNHGNWRLRFKDDADQCRHGGLRHGITGARVSNDSFPGYGRGMIELENLRDDALGRCYITHAVSESYDSSVVFVGARQLKRLGSIHCRILGNPALASEGAVLEIALPQADQAEILLYDNYGRLVRQLFSGRLPAGVQRLDLPAQGLPSGLYFIVVTTPNGQGAAKWIIAR